MLLTQGMIGKRLSVLCKDGTCHEGKCVSYIPAKDNEPEIDSIWIQEKNGSAFELYAPDIIEVHRLSEDR